MIERADGGMYVREELRPHVVPHGRLTDETPGTIPRDPGG